MEVEQRNINVSTPTLTLPLKEAGMLRYSIGSKLRLQAICCAAS